MDGDAFFVRDLRKVARYKDDQLKKLAIIADAIIGSHDLTLFALEVLQERGETDATVVDAYFAAIPEEHLRG